MLFAWSTFLFQNNQYQVSGWKFGCCFPFCYNCCQRGLTVFGVRPESSSVNIIVSTESRCFIYCSVSQEYWRGFVLDGPNWMFYSMESVAGLPWTGIVYVALDSSYLVWVLKAFILEEFIWQFSPLLLEKQKRIKPVCLFLLSRATTSYPKMLKHIAVCISEYHILCGMHILLVCLAQVVDEVHLCVQMWTHVFKIFFFLEGEVWGNNCKVSRGPFPAFDSVWTSTTD